MKFLFRRYYINANGNRNGTYMDWFSIGEHSTGTLSYHSIRKEYSVSVGIGRPFVFSSHDEAIAFLIELALA